MPMLLKGIPSLGAGEHVNYLIIASTITAGSFALLGKRTRLLKTGNKVGTMTTY